MIASPIRSVVLGGVRGLRRILRESVIVYSLLFQSVWRRLENFARSHHVEIFPGFKQRVISYSGKFVH